MPPAAVTERQRPAREPVAETEKSGRDVYEHLRNTGTGTDRLKIVETFLTGNQRATGREVVEHLIGSNTQVGTIRKAGKYVFGDDWDYRDPDSVPSDAVKALRMENEEIKRQLREVEGRCAVLTREVGNLRNQLAVAAQIGQTGRIQAGDQKPTA